MENSNKKINRIVASIVILFLILGAVGGFLYSHLNDDRNIVNALAKETAPSQTQVINGADRFISFDFVSDFEVCESNFTKFVEVKNITGELAPCNFEKLSENKFRIAAPEAGYVAGANYVIVLSDTKFLNSEIDSSKPFYFSITRDAIENVIV